MVAKICRADGFLFLTTALSVLTTLIGISACPLQSLEAQRAFVYLTVATLLCVVASLVWQGFRTTLYRRVLWMGGIVPLTCLWGYLLWTYEIYGTIREMSARGQMINNSKQIGLGTHSFHDKHKRLPVDVRDAAGWPLLSWRVSICPYLEALPLYHQFDLTQAWDSPGNRPLVEKMPWTYGSVLFQETPGITPWQGFVGPGTAFEPGNAALSLTRDFPDGTSNTILIVEAQQQVPWSKAADIPYGPGIPLPPLGQNYLQRGEWPFCCPVRTTPRFCVCMADGTVRFFSANTSDEVLRAMIVRNDGRPAEVPD